MGKITIEETVIRGVKGTGSWRFRGHHVLASYSKPLLIGLKQNFAFFAFFAKIVSEDIKKFHDLAKMLAKIFAEINKYPKGYYKIGKTCERKYVFVFEKLFETTNCFAKIYAKWRGGTIFVNFVKTDKTSRIFAFYPTL